MFFFREHTAVDLAIKHSAMTGLMNLYICFLLKQYIEHCDCEYVAAIVLNDKGYTILRYWVLFDCMAISLSCEIIRSFT